MHARTRYLGKSTCVQTVERSPTVTRVVAQCGRYIAGKLVQDATVSQPLIRKEGCRSSGREPHGGGKPRKMRRNDMKRG